MEFPHPSERKRSVDENEPDLSRDIVPERKAAYYLGAAFQVVGLLVSVSVFLSAALSIDDHSNHDSDGRSLMLRAAIGFALMIVGGVIRGVGARGLAGSGVVLDPQRARRDLEPYSRMAGGMAQDALDEAGVAPRLRPVEVVKLRCRACGRLNEEDSKFCQECGQAI